MSAALLTIAATLAFAGANVTLARGAQFNSLRPAVVLSVHLGVPFFLLVAAVSGQLARATPAALGFFAAAGIVHFVIGRSVMYRAIGLLGASRAMLFMSLTPVCSLGLAIVLFDESLAPLAVAGAVLAIAGPLAATRATAAPAAAAAEPSKRGAVLALLGAICWGVSPILIKSGLDRDVRAATGTLVSYAAAAAVFIIGSRARDILTQFRGLPTGAMRWFVWSALFTNVAQLLLFMALEAGDVTTVVVLTQLTPLMVTGATFVVNRGVERVTRGLVLGGALAVFGAMLVVAAP